MRGFPWSWEPWRRIVVLPRRGKTEAAVERLPSEILRAALPEHPRFAFEVNHRSKHGATVVIKVREGVFADGESGRRVYVPYRAVHENLDAVVRMLIEGSEHALEW